MEGQFGEETFGGVEVKPQEEVSQEVQVNTEFNLPTKVSVWTKIKNFLFQDIKVELTPKQQKIEDEINEFLHQEITWGKIHDFLFQEISFKKNK